ncbi:hypothetical protein C7N43_39530 [Sphingobacteriales bacterium UPWRP_1]|nr:hypothetical protein C7N43_39530 [Sphingobacteriales bacterium UPWRP_1]
MKNKNAIAIIVMLLIAVVAIVLLMPQKTATATTAPAQNQPSGNVGTSGGNNVGIAIIENADDILNSVFGFIKGIRDKKKANAQTTANISNTNIDASVYGNGITT